MTGGNLQQLNSTRLDGPGRGPRKTTSEKPEATRLTVGDLRQRISVSLLGALNSPRPSTTNFTLFGTAPPPRPPKTMLANRRRPGWPKKSSPTRFTFSFQRCFGGVGADSGPGEVKLLSRVSGYRAQPPRPNRVLRVTDTRPRSEVIASGHTASNAPDLFRLRRPRAMSRSPRLVRVALDFIQSSARRPRQVSFAPVCIRHGRSLA